MASPQISRLDQVVRRLFNLKSGFTTDVADTVMPVISLTDPNDPTVSHLRGERRVSGVRAQPGVAASNSTIHAMAAPGHLLIVTRVIVTTTAASTVLVVIDPGQLLVNPVGAAPIFCTDGRDIKDIPFTADANQTKAGGQLFRETPGAVPGIAIQGSFNTPAGTSITVPLDVTLFTNQGGIGSRLTFADSTQNDALTVWLQGYERLLEPSETF
jgi:hypothetical protein